MALKAIVEDDYEDYMRSTFQAGINKSTLQMSSEGEETVGRRSEKKIMMQRASSDFDIAVDGTPLLSKKSMPKKVLLGSEYEITERNDERSE